MWFQDFVERHEVGGVSLIGETDLAFDESVGLSGFANDSLTNMSLCMCNGGCVGASHLFILDSNSCFSVTQQKVSLFHSFIILLHKSQSYAINTLHYQVSYSVISHTHHASEIARACRLHPPGRASVDREAKLKHLFRIQFMQRLLWCPARLFIECDVWLCCWKEGAGGNI